MISPMHVTHAQNECDWESFLQSQSWSPFLQSWTMGEVYRAMGQEPVRLEIRDRVGVRDDDNIVGICQAIVVPAKRGKHLSVPYGPLLGEIPSSKHQIPGASIIS